MNNTLKKIGTTDKLVNNKVADQDTTVHEKKNKKQCKGTEKPVGTCCAPTKCKSGYSYMDSQGPDGGGACFKDSQIEAKNMECAFDGAGAGASCKCNNKKYSCKLICY